MSPELSRWKVEHAADYLNVTRQRQAGANSRPGNALPTCAEWTEAAMASHREGRHVFPRGHVRPGKEGWGSPRHQCYSPRQARRGVAGRTESPTRDPSCSHRMRRPPGQGKWYNIDLWGTLCRKVVVLVRRGNTPRLVLGNHSAFPSRGKPRVAVPDNVGLANSPTPNPSPSANVPPH